MQVVKGYPPNYSTILQYLTPSPDAVFAYADTIYNPTDKDIPEDVYIHEEVHGNQMKDWQPDAWWLNYLMDKKFRFKMEVEAFSSQYQWVKNRVPNKVAKLCLHDLACNLSAVWYNLNITYSQAQTLIRKNAK